MSIMLGIVDWPTALLKECQFARRNPLYMKGLAQPKGNGGVYLKSEYGDSDAAVELEAHCVRHRLRGAGNGIGARQRGHQSIRRNCRSQRLRAQTTSATASARRADGPTCADGTSHADRFAEYVWRAAGAARNHRRARQGW